MLLSFPFLRPCTWDRVESELKWDSELSPYPAYNPLESLERALDEVHCGENPGHLRQHNHHPHLTCSQEKLLLVYISILER